MLATKRQPQVFDRVFEVEWCTDIPLNEFGDLDIDAAKMAIRRFMSIGGARRYARKVYPTDAFGSIRITPMRFTPYTDDDAYIYPHVGFWEATGESEFYEGEDHQ